MKISVTGEPTGIAFNPDNGYLYVAHYGSVHVSVIDGSTNTVVGAPIRVGQHPQNIAFNPNNGYLYVTNQIDDNVSIIDGSTNTVVGPPIPVVGAGPEYDGLASFHVNYDTIWHSYNTEGNSRDLLFKLTNN